MARIKKGHHHIPRTYLENFANVSGVVAVLKEDGTIYTTKPENIFKEAYFYTVTLADGSGSLVVEDTLANIEGAFSSIYKEKIAESKELTQDERAKVAVFLAALYLRTKNHREGLRGAMTTLRDRMSEWKEMFEKNEAARRLSANLPRSDGERVSLNDVSDAVENLDEFHSTSIMNNLPEIAQLIYDMKWHTVSAPSGEQFITSDAPFQVLRPESIEKYGSGVIGSTPGLAYEDAEVTVPISSQKALLMGWRIEKDADILADQQRLNQINWRSGMHAKDLVARDRVKLEEILAKIEEQEAQS